MSKMKKIFMLIIISFLSIIVLSGCAGVAKFRSDELGHSIKWGSIPSDRSISIRMLRQVGPRERTGGINVNLLFGELLSGKLREGQLYDEAKIISSDEAIATRLLLEAAVINVGKMAAPSVRGEGPEPKSSFAIAGRLVDTKGDEVLLTFAATRSSAREGIVPLPLPGVWLTVSHDTLIKNLMKWLAEDVVALLKRMREGGN